MMHENSKRLEKNRQPERIHKLDDGTESSRFKETVWRTLLGTAVPEKRDDAEGKKVSPEFPTESKAETFAMDWMNKHPRGLDEPHARAVM
jgi:hypothetical protein